MKAFWMGLALAASAGGIQDTKPEEEISGEVVRTFGALDRQMKDEWKPVLPPTDKPVEWPARQVWRSNPSRPAQVRLSNGVRFDLQSASEISLLRTKSRYRFCLQKGECLFDIGFTSGKPPEEVIEVVLPKGEVAVPASTKAFVRVVCRVDKDKDHVAVLNGQVTVKTKEETVDIKQGEGLEVDTKGGGLKPQKEDVLTQAAWTRWEEKQRAKKNLLKDGDMEASRNADWKTENATASKELREVFEGRQSLKVVAGTGSDHHPRAYQEVKVAPGKRFRLTGWLKSGKRIPHIAFETKTGDKLASPLEPPDNTPTGQWVYCEKDLQIPEGMNCLRVVLPCASGDTVYWDDVILTVEEK